VGSITSTQFCFIRSILEDIHDYSILADVIKLLSSADQPELCASLFDTLNHHFDIFEIIGAANPCMDLFLARYKLSRSQQKTSEAMVQSLLDACTRFPKLADTVKILRHDLIQHRQATAVSACSPVSDHMVDMTQSRDMTFAEDMEKALASGTSIDKPTLIRLFEALSGRIEESWQDSKSSSRSLAILLAKLQTFGSTLLNELLSNWLSRTLGMTRRPSLLIVLSPLVESGCIDIQQIIRSTKEFLAVNLVDDLLQRSLLIVEVLQLLTTLGSRGSKTGYVSLPMEYRSCF
jgi:mediator of RNA polymerase II transcription subunit 12